MLDTVEVREALRARLLTVVVATTGSTTLSATTAGYARAVGSFITDGFAAGMEVVPAGFPTNVPKMVESVTPLLITITGGLTATGAAGGRTLTVGLPVAKQWEGTQTPYETAPGTRPFVLEQFVPASNGLITFPADGGAIEETGLYVVTWFGVPNKGIVAMYRQVDAVKALFSPGTVLLTESDEVIRISSGLNVGQLITTENGYVTIQVAIPWRGITANQVFLVPTDYELLLESGDNLLLENGSTLLMEAA